MKIEINEPALDALYQLQPGDTFIVPGGHYEGRLFMRTDIHKEGRITCYDLECGSQLLLQDDLYVREIKTKVVKA